MYDSCEEIEQQLGAIPYWYHRIPPPPGVVTPGWAPMNADVYNVPADLTSKERFSTLALGMVTGRSKHCAAALRKWLRLMISQTNLSSLESSDRKAWEAFDLCREILGYDTTRCQRREMSGYDLSEEQLGRFDVVFFFGTLYHLRHHLLALDFISALCDGDIFVESAILDDFSPYRGGIGQGYPDDQMVMEFYPGEEYGDNMTNWWGAHVAVFVEHGRERGFLQ